MIINMIRPIVDAVDRTLEFVITDFHQDRYRFVLEMIGMIASIGASVVLAATVPEPNIGWCYGLWMIGSTCLIISSISRGSTGFTVIYGTFLLVDSIGALRWFGIF